MTDSSHLPEEMAIANEQALEELAWAIAASSGEFKLILARCNYASVREPMVQRLPALVSGEIRTLGLKASDQTLFSTIREFLGAQVPYALMVFGLEVVRDLDRLLIATNQVREEFRQHFPFPLVLWVDDYVLQQMMRIAPDFESWATTVTFAIASDELLQSLRQAADFVFANILSSEGGVIQELPVQIGSLRRQEIEAAIQDLRSRGQELTLDLKASLEFVRGQNAYARNEVEVAIDRYQQSLGFWQDWGVGAASHNLKLAVVQFHLGLCYFQQGERNPTPKSHLCWENAREYFQQCVDTLAAANRPDLVAKLINPLGEVLQRLADWDDLQQVAQKSWELQQAYPNPVRLAQAYGFLAAGALQSSRWETAQQNALDALEAISSVAEVQQRQYQGWYLLLLAASERHLGQQAQAIAHLEQAKEIGPEDNPHNYIRILDALRQLYFEHKQYLEAYRIRKQRRSIQQQYGLRAFIGAGRIQPQRQVKLALAPVVDTSNFASQETVASEIAASGRQLDVERLIEKIGRPDCKLIVIHGPSGVGKSSLVYGGLVPSLKQKVIGTADVLPVAIRVYTNWIAELGTLLAAALAEKRRQRHGEAKTSLAAILQELQDNESRHLRTVLIFDQFEEFFFVNPEPAKRQQFFEFLGACLNILSVKVILSLREDYLHYLLECDRLSSMKIIGNDILTKNVRYPLGNFSPDDAKLIIKQLTERSYCYLDPDLIAELVQDLAKDLGSVRPIELQIVGAQLQTETITTLSQYRERGPKIELVKRYLQEVVDDCGTENQQAAELILYLLTDEKGTRPLRTRAELERDLQALALADATTQVNQLDLVLEIFVESGLVVLLSEIPAQRYQLVHDYIAAFIRQQQEPLKAQLEKEREQRQQTEKELKQTEQARQILEEANNKAQETNNKANRRIRIGSAILAASVVVAAVTGIWASKTNRNLEIETLELDGVKAQQEFDSQQIGALVLAVQAGQHLQSLVKDNLPLEKYPTVSPILALQTILDNIQEQTQLKGHTSLVYSASYSPDGQHIVTASYDNTARIWDTTGKQVALLKGHTSPVYSASYSPDGQHIVTASYDNTARIWDTTGKQVALLKGHTSPVYSASYSPDGQHIVTASYDNTARIWDTTGKQVALLKGHTSPVGSASYSPDGQHIVTASGDNTARIWDTTGKQVALLKGHTSPVYSASYSPDGQHIVTASTDHTARIWDTIGQQVTVLKGHTSWVYSASYSPDGQHIVTASYDNTARIWDTTGKQVALLKGHTSRVNSASYSPDGQHIVTASDDNTARIWDTTGQQVALLKRHTSRVNSASYSPDGQHIVTASYDNTARIWDTTGKQVALLKGHTSRVNSASYSPDGQHIVTASYDNTARIWDTTGKQVALLKGHTSRVNSASYSPDGQHIVTASYDNTARIWDTTGQQVALLKGHTSWVYSANYSPDGQHIVTASYDNTARVWSVRSLEQLLSQSCAWLNNYLITHPTDLETLKVCQTKTNLIAAAPVLVQEGEEQARGNDFEASVASFRQALKWNPSLNINPEAKAKPLVEATKLVNDGEQLAQAGNIESAVAAFQKAIQLDRSFEFEITTKAFSALLEEGKSLADEAKVKEAIAAYAQAQKVAPKLEISVGSWNTLCRRGSLHDHAKEVMFACEKAVLLAPENGEYRDSRGLARALTGNNKGAIEDIQVYIAGTDDKEKKVQRQRWINALRAGKNPFTRQEIESLMNQ